MSRHKGSGQSLVRFVEHREENRRGPVRDVYLGVHGSAAAGHRYDEEIRDWVDRSLRVGWCPESWQPARTGHAGVLTVGGVVEAFGERLAGSWGTGWRDVEVDAVQVRRYREDLERALELIRQARRMGRHDGSRQEHRGAWDHELLDQGKRLRREAGERFGHLDGGLHRLLTARVLEDLLGDFGPVAAAALGDRELRRLRAKWAGRGLSLSDRKVGMKVVQDAFVHVIGRKPSAPWDLDRSFLERHAEEYGLDLGIVGEGGRWVKRDS